MLWKSETFIQSRTVIHLENCFSIFKQNGISLHQQIWYNLLPSEMTIDRAASKACYSETLFLSDEGPMLETLDFAFYIGSTPTFLYFDLYLNTAFATHYVYSYQAALVA